jgi:ectoine hydroxylase-related dioxygenase (phytanoyl-CoA dioxygenase family)
VGPDVLALQTMLFLKPPGAPGQGYHQDSFHIITKPDTLIGAWIALDRADEENGCLLVTAGSQAEPIYPDADESKGHGGDHRLEGIGAVAHADDPDESVNELTRVAARYRGREVAAGLEPGDAVFFGGHLLHRSHANRSATRSRRAFVAHYCDARSLVPWDDEPLGTGRPATPGTSSPAATPICRTRGRAGLEVRRRAPRARRSGSAGAAARARSSPARPSPGPRAARSSSAGRA